MKQAILATLMAGAFGFFAYTLRRYTRVALLGAADPRPRFDQLPKRLAMVLVYFFGQKRVAEKQLAPAAPSYHHLWIFWGFLIITLGTGELFVAGVWPSFHLGLFMPAGAYGAMKWLVDLFNLIVLALVGFAFFRRIVIRPRLIPMNLDAAAILGAIAGPFAALTCAISSSALALAPSRSTISAATASPHFGLGAPTTQHCATAGCAAKASSTSRG